MLKCDNIWNLKNKFLTLLAMLLIPLYIALELCFFISDQYVFYRCAIDEGLSYDTKDGKFELIANNESDKLLLKEGQRRAAWIGSCNHSVRLLLGLLTTMIIGYISDRFGRRLSLGIMIIGEALQIITLSVIVLLQANPWLTIIPGLFDGIIGGGLLSIQAQVSASLTDLVSKESVDSNDVTNSQVTNQNNLWTLFTWFDGLALISLSLSNPIGGIFLYRDGFRLPIIICNILIGISLLFIFFLPESMKIFQSNYSNLDTLYHDQDYKNKDNDIEIIFVPNKNFSFWEVNCQSIQNSFKIINGKYKQHVLIGFIVLLLSIVTSTDLYIIYIYLMGYSFLWNSQDVGIYSGVTDIISAIIAIIFTLLMARIIHRPVSKSSDSIAQNIFDTNHDNKQLNKVKCQSVNLLLKILIFSIFMMFINRTILGLSHLFDTYTANTLVYIATIPRFAKGLNNPILRTLISMWTDQSKQGMMHSFVAFVSRLGVLICFSVLILIYSSTTHLFPGAVFLVCSSLILIALITTGFLYGLTNTSVDIGQMENTSENMKYTNQIS
uniref:MFS domain-containing protein n=1 Tax=Schistosoma mansoni TaxID=6183 RepID=A0A5K4FD01_SCHMA